MTAEVFIKFRVRALLDSKNLSHGPYLTGVVMNNKRSFTGRGKGGEATSHPHKTQAPSQFCSLNPLQAPSYPSMASQSQRKEKGSTKLQANFKRALIEVTRRELSIVNASYNSNKQSSLKNDACIPKKHSACQV